MTDFSISRKSHLYEVCDCAILIHKIDSAILEAYNGGASSMGSNEQVIDADIT